MFTYLNNLSRLGAFRFLTLFLGLALYTVLILVVGQFPLVRNFYDSLNVGDLVRFAGWFKDVSATAAVTILYPLLTLVLLAVVSAAITGTNLSSLLRVLAIFISLLDSAILTGLLGTDTLLFSPSVAYVFLIAFVVEQLFQKAEAFVDKIGSLRQQVAEFKENRKNFEEEKKQFHLDRKAAMFEDFAKYLDTEEGEAFFRRILRNAPSYTVGRRGALRRCCKGRKFLRSLS